MTTKVRNPRRTWEIGIILTALVGLISTHPARADETTAAPQKEPLERPAFRPIHPQSTCRRREHLVSMIGAMRSRLAKEPAETRSAWEGYLRLHELSESLNGPVEFQLKQLETLRMRLSVDIEGFEEAEPANLRAAANAYAISLRLGRIDLEAAFEHDMDDLAERLVEYGRKPSQAGADEIGVILGRLEAAEQAADLTAAVRRRWSQPNIVAYVNTDFVNGYLARDIAHAGFQTANVLGTRTSGMSRTAGRLEVVTIENQECAEFELRLTGTSHADRNTGRNGPATITSSSSSRFRLAKTVRVDGEQGLVVDPAKVCCSADINVSNIDVETRLLPALSKGAATRVAWNKVRESEAAVEREVARLVGQRIDTRLVEDLAGPLNTARDYFRTYLVDRPSRYDEAPVISSRSTTDGVFLRLLQARAHQLGAPGDAPPFESETKFGVAIHQSAFNNASSRSVFGGGLQTDEQIEHYAQLVGGEVPHALRVFSTSVPWSVRLDVERPNTLVLDDGKIDLTIHTKAWTIGERTFERPIDLKVTYQVANSPLGMTFTRVGSPQFAPVDGRAWTADERSTLVPHVEAKFAAAFPETGRFNVLIVPKGDAFGPLGNADMRQISCDDGWLLIGYQ